jgi:hypothetical protein
VTGATHRLNKQCCGTILGIPTQENQPIEPLYSRKVGNNPHLTAEKDPTYGTYQRGYKETYCETSRLQGSSSGRESSDDHSDSKEGVEDVSVKPHELTSKPLPLSPKCSDRVKMIATHGDWLSESIPKNHLEC